MKILVTAARKCQKIRGTPFSATLLLWSCFFVSRRRVELFLRNKCYGSNKSAQCQLEVVI